MVVETRCDHVAIAGEGWTYCPACGSTCSRDPKDGKILTFERGSKDVPAQAQASLKQAVQAQASLKQAVQA